MMGCQGAHGLKRKLGTALVFIECKCKRVKVDERMKVWER
jgi:hypothetical protein